MSAFVSGYYFVRHKGQKVVELNAILKTLGQDIGGAEKKLLSLRAQASSEKTEVAEERRMLGEQLLDLQNQWENLNEETKELQQLKKNADDIAAELSEQSQLLADITRETDAAKDSYQHKKAELESLVQKLAIYSEIEDYVLEGHFEIPEYLYETSERFTAEIKSNRQDQRDLIKQRAAATYKPDLKIVTDPKSNKSILDGQLSLMLQAFNLSCDYLMSRVRPSNFKRTLKAIDDSATKIEKAAVSLHCGFALEYVNLKFQECELVYQYRLKRQEEEEEQKVIKAQIREEAKAVREYQRALVKAEREERDYRRLLEKARTELGVANEAEKENAQKRIAELEAQLKEAQAKEERAKSMAEQTKRGHVYVISNIGSFGDNIYKIGLTRRLDPFERVKELGDASVPFRFDIHAMIYCENAPKLEAELHRKFSHFRVNTINHRKEFFRIDLETIRKEAERLSAGKIEFKMTALAEEYRETERLRNSKVPTGGIVS